MPTNEERREVAARLREIETDNYCRCGDYLEAVEYAIGCIVGKDYKEPTNRLADLIEPAPERTCHVVSTIRYDYEGGYAGAEYVTKLSCGHKHTDSYGDAPNFCSECGARVIE